MAVISISSSRFDKVEVDESKLIFVDGGILGFPVCDRFVMFDHAPDSPFKWLQSMDDGDVAFVVTDPKLFFPDYIANIKQEELAVIDYQKDDELVVLTICSLKGKPTDMTVNLQGPVIVNLRNRQGRQFVLKGSKYHTRHPLFPNLPEEGKAADQPFESKENNSKSR